MADFSKTSRAFDDLLVDVANAIQDTAMPQPCTETAKVDWPSMTAEEVVAAVRSRPTVLGPWEAWTHSPGWSRHEIPPIATDGAMRHLSIQPSTSRGEWIISGLGEYGSVQVAPHESANELADVVFGGAFGGGALAADAEGAEALEEEGMLGASLLCSRFWHFTFLVARRQGQPLGGGIEGARLVELEAFGDVPAHGDAGGGGAEAELVGEVWGESKNDSLGPSCAFWRGRTRGILPAFRGRLRGIFSGIFGHGEFPPDGLSRPSSRGFFYGLILLDTFYHDPLIPTAN